METGPWPPEWRRGLLPTAALGALSTEPLYGYGFSQRLERAGWGTVTGGTLYPILRSLEASGLLTSRWQADRPGPARKYYELTPQGREVARRHHDAWPRFHESMNELLGGRESPP